MRRGRIGSAAALALLLAACSSGSKDEGGAGTLLIVVNAPFSVSPAIGQTILQGTQLAVDEINRAGGISAGGRAYRLRVERMDNALSAQQGLENVRRAVDQHALAIVDEGTGVDASWREAARAHVPICIVYQGGSGLIDPAQRTNVFRIAPTDHGIAFRYAEHLVPQDLKVALLHDDSGYGQEGAAALHQAFGFTPKAVAADVVLPGGGQDLSPQILEARRSGATALVVWAQATTLAQAVRTARQSGWDVPIYAPPAGEDPLVRQELSDHPECVDGMTFAAGRMTAEAGPEPFLEFQRDYERAFGPDEVGVKTSDGDDVVQPPDYAMYPFDFVNVLAAAVAGAGGPDGSKVVSSLEQVDVRGANGDERSFNEKNHEGVVDDDVYFAVFHDMTFRPVEDDPLSSTLPVIDQTR